MPTKSTKAAETATTSDALTTENPDTPKATSKATKVTKEIITEAAQATKTKTASKAKAKSAVPKGTEHLSALLESGAHFGHQTRRWNPKMGKYIFAAKNNIHIIDLVQTNDRLIAAQKFVRELAAGGGSVLFVGTKRQARSIIKAAAESVDMPYVSERWLGGMLTNFATISARIKHLKNLEQQRDEQTRGHLTKKEQLLADREIDDLNRVLGGIKNMPKVPEAVFIVDVPRELIAISEARNLGLPVIGMLDTNADPDLVDWPIPANDDAIRAVKLVTEAIADAVRAGRAEYDAKTAAKTESESQV